MKLQNNRLDQVESKIKDIDKPTFQLGELQKLVKNTLNVVSDSLTHYNQPYDYWHVLYNAIINRSDPRLKGYQLALTDIERKLEKMQETLQGYD